MLLEPSEDQDFLRETTARYLDDKVPPAVVRTLRDDPAGFDPTYWSEGVQLGWTHLLVPEELGGGSASGDGVVDLSLIAYEFGRRAAPGPLLPNAVVAGALARGGGHDDVVAELLAGEAVATWATADVDHSGAPPLFHIRVEGSEIVLDGIRRPVESAAVSDYLLVSAETTVGSDEGGATQVLISRDTPGVTITAMHTIDLTRRFSVVTFDGVRVPLDAAVGSIGAADAELAEQHLHALVIANAEAVGAMQTAFDLTLEWTFDRYSFGRPLASYQAIKHRMAKMKMWLEASHAIADESAAAVGSGSPLATKLTSAAKSYIGDSGSELMQECVQLHGGIGVTYEHDLHLYFRRHTVNRALHGTPAEHRLQVADEIESHGVAS